MTAPNHTLDRELAQVLRTGPFSVALHLAIESRGWTLDRVQRGLLGHGVGLSLSTLSYWRRGRSRPERPASLRAVHLIERLLDLPEGSLTRLLDPRTRPPRQLAHPGLAPDRLWSAPAGLARTLRQLTAPPQDQLLRVSVHEELEIGADRHLRLTRTRLVLLALADRVSHCRVVYWAEVPGTEPPTVGATRFCRPGRTRADRDSGFWVTELVLDRMLHRGEYATLEYEVRPGPTADVIDEFTRRTAVPIREYALSVWFDPAALPARCVRLDRRTADGPAADGEELWLGASGTAQLVVIDAPPGQVGMRWEWS
ncbi:hypothetical protein R8Z50_14345 [Longispora sp. K20-0274]|uniref:hypothetical protein n=1 Tax=Longispora sp. K20-0274 TaxID=3088255 RepID=UPI0039999132